MDIAKAETAQNATETHMLGIKVNDAANMPETTAVPIVSGFLPTRLTSLPPTIAPTVPAIAAIEENNAAVVGVDPGLVEPGNGAFHLAMGWHVGGAVGHDSMPGTVVGDDVVDASAHVEKIDPPADWNPGDTRIELIVVHADEGPARVAGRLFTGQDTKQDAERRKARPHEEPSSWSDAPGRRVAYS